MPDSFQGSAVRLLRVRTEASPQISVASRLLSRPPKGLTALDGTPPAGLTQDQWDWILTASKNHQFADENDNSNQTGDAIPNFPAIKRPAASFVFNNKNCLGERREHGLGYGIALDPHGDIRRERERLERTTQAADLTIAFLEGMKAGWEDCPAYSPIESLKGALSCASEAAQAVWFVYLNVSRARLTGVDVQSRLFNGELEGLEGLVHPSELAWWTKFHTQIKPAAQQAVDEVLASIDGLDQLSPDEYREVEAYLMGYATFMIVEGAVTATIATELRATKIMAKLEAKFPKLAKGIDAFIMDEDGNIGLPGDRALEKLKEVRKFMQKTNLNGDPSSAQNMFLFENRGLTVQQFLGKYRAGGVKGVMPGEALGMTVEEALRVKGGVGGVNVRKLLLDLRDKFVK